MAEVVQSEISIARPETWRMSYDEYRALPDDVRAEWKEGVVILRMPPKKYHQRVVEFLHSLLGLFVQTLDLGRVGIAPFEVRLGPGGPSREPDLFFVATESLHRWTDDRFEGGPELVVEVISNDSVGRDRGDKFYEFQEAGVREYWIIDPRPGKERADFYALDPDGRFQPLLPNEHGIFSSRVLPGLALNTLWLWREPVPSSIGILMDLARSDPAVAAALNRILGQAGTS